ncbi:MAG TPA: alpha-glucan family phosphorylase [Bacteroidales bacterium]|nr:alpha-glucan family phosphorylase [Bacteroidales bacterium]
MIFADKVLPDHLFEVSWEICNKAGGIYTAISTKTPFLTEKLRDNYILIGPDVWKETGANPDFAEDRNLLRYWREQAANKGLFFRIGRWNVPSSPLVILVDFTSYFPVKDSVFSDFWNHFRLDSISGQWDYIEPALFGYAAAKVIESYYEFYMTSDDRIIAHFHDWMSGVGVLYLKKYVPQVGTVFTVHSTVTGRAIASNNLPLYRDFDVYHAENIARQFNLVAKHSLETLAANQSDVFTTVSEATAKECYRFLNRNPDLITPNGFDLHEQRFQDQFDYLRKVSRKKLFSITQSLAGNIPDDALAIIAGGRYEFRNKGLDLVIDALGKINADQKWSKNILALIVLPANHAGPRMELLQRITENELATEHAPEFLTHNLFDPEFDPILKRFRSKGLLNRKDDKVKVVFVPNFLDGYDGVFNIPFAELLPGFDLTISPSYYEPWGYTPLLSLALGVPVIGSSLSGFSSFISRNSEGEIPSMAIINRNDDNYNSSIDDIIDSIGRLASLSETAVQEIRANAIQTAAIASWKSLLPHYVDAYDKALNISWERKHLFRYKRHVESPMDQTVEKLPVFEWRKVLVNTSMPENLNKLALIARNLWWSWNQEATELFQSIDPILWEKVHQNPIALKESLSYKRLLQLSTDVEFVERVDHVYNLLTDYVDEGFAFPEKPIAYFSMEFAIHDSLKIYSGGLGVLAGDYLKEASDSRCNMIGIGLLYRYGYFQQSVSLQGDQIASAIPQKFAQLPLQPVRNDDGTWTLISIALPGRNMFAKVWRVDVGRVPLYLLDTDIPENSDYDRAVTHQLYGGDHENRFKQEFLLGVGGIRMLEALKISPSLYHLNEGHAAFATLERLRHLIHAGKFTFNQAVELLRSTTLFTTHTPVPAGHDAFSEDLLRAYIPHYAERLNISWDVFMNLGRWKAGNTEEKFSMSVLASRLSQHMNGVSRIHGRVSREMFASLYEGYFPEELHIGHVTNGVHYPTWTAWGWQKLYNQTFGKQFLSDVSNPEFWSKIDKVDNGTIWKLRNQLRSNLIQYVQKRVQYDMTRRQENPKLILKVLDSIDENALTVGFARRFATYKRAHLLFSNIERLAELVNSPGRPLQFIFAGKAHPADTAGQDLIKRIITISKQTEFLGKILFVENYDMELAIKLVQGVDVWMNTPARPLEASGTSGQKAVLNGVLNLSVLDGWWAEGYKPGAGWALPEERVYANTAFQDELDSESLYNLFRDEIVPLFYEKNKHQVPEKWIGYIKNNISTIAPIFTTKRMLHDYTENYYKPIVQRSSILIANDFEMTRHLSAWKRKVARVWPNLTVVATELPDSTHKPLNLGDEFYARVEIYIDELQPEDVGVEVVFGQKDNDAVDKIIELRELHLENIEGNKVTYSVRFALQVSGVYDYAFRIFPKNPLLAHRQDFQLVTWF